MSLSTFSFTATSTTQLYTLSLHDALPISPYARGRAKPHVNNSKPKVEGSDTRRNEPENYSGLVNDGNNASISSRSEEHTSELQSRGHLVCRLLLEKKKNKKT